MGVLASIGYAVRNIFLVKLYHWHLNHVEHIQTVSGMVMGVFPPIEPPIVPTPQRVLDASAALRADILLVVPSFCEVSDTRLTSLSHCSLTFCRAGHRTNKPSKRLPASILLCVEQITRRRLPSSFLISYLRADLWIEELATLWPRKALTYVRYLGRKCCFVVIGIVIGLHPFLNKYSKYALAQSLGVSQHIL